MSVLARNMAKSSNELFIKGAPEYLVANASKIMTKSGKIAALNKENK